MKRYYFLLLLAAVIAGCGGGGDSKPRNSGSSTQTTKQSRPQLKVEDAILTFDGIGSVANTAMSNVQGKITYQILSSTPSDVVQIDDGQLQILRPGTASIKVTDSSPTYETSEATFTITVDKGTNADLSANDVSLNASETEGRSLVVRGQKGSLSYAVESGSEHLIQVNTDGRVFAIGKSGTA
ncbi:hypothetical protein ACOMICROBIO_NCLOACGD_02606 [Vibrio sp. B1ASS3]|nr:hypothetical protein ACOMICROBIO_NCLOACGD_02606 [Vibrio sp. B1ASS3]CAE6918716.1 hypothetical protein ACOMICROBIO_NCLOACGD_02606 [Vibrio sp. B1ASS3]